MKQTRLASCQEDVIPELRSVMRADEIKLILYLQCIRTSLVTKSQHDIWCNFPVPLSRLHQSGLIHVRDKPWKWNQRQTKCEAKSILFAFFNGGSDVKLSTEIADEIPCENFMVSRPEMSSFAAYNLQAPAQAVRCHALLRRSLLAHHTIANVADVLDTQNVRLCSGSVSPCLS